LQPHDTTTIEAQLDTSDPFSLSQYKTIEISRTDLKAAYPNGQYRKIKDYYTQQNEMIDTFLQSGDEEHLDAEDKAKNGGKVKFAVNASFAVNFCLFVIQLYAAISTGSLSLFATAADAFMDLVSSIVMLVTSRLAAKPSQQKYP
jgi:hypothetical protein